MISKRTSNYFLSTIELLFGKHWFSQPFGSDGYSVRAKSKAEDISDFTQVLKEALVEPSNDFIDENASLHGHHGSRPKRNRDLGWQNIPNDLAFLTEFGRIRVIGEVAEWSKAPDC